MGTVYEYPVVTGFDGIAPDFHGQTTEYNIGLIHNNGLTILSDSDTNLFVNIGSSVSGVRAAFWRENNRLHRIETPASTTAYRSYSSHRWPYVQLHESIELLFYTGDWVFTSSTILDGVDIDVDIYDSREEAEIAIGYSSLFPITYRSSNITFPNAPTEARVGSTVTVNVSFPDGYGLANPNDLYVQCNGVVVPSVYANGQLTFTMPDPS